MRALLFALLLLAVPAAAEPLAQLERDGIRIVLYSEPCALTTKIVNLPRRAEWTAVGRVFQGCWALSPFGIIAMYFDDMTVTVVPAQVFSVVREI